MADGLEHVTLRSVERTGTGWGLWIGAGRRKQVNDGQKGSVGVEDVPPLGNGRGRTWGRKDVACAAGPKYFSEQSEPNVCSPLLSVRATRWGISLGGVAKEVVEIAEFHSAGLGERASPLSRLYSEGTYMLGDISNQRSTKLDDLRIG